MNADTAERFEAGFSRRCTTPRVPASLAGYFTPRPWDCVLDDLFVQAVAFRRGNRTAVLLQADLIRVPTHYLTELRRRCADLPELASGCLLATGSHTHTAPEPLAQSKGGNAAYTEFVLRQAEAAVRDAVADVAPAQLSFGCASNTACAFNRRYWMRSGEVVTNPPRRDPGIIGPEGPVDPEIPLLRVHRRGRPDLLFASIVNHCDTVSGTGVSADWPGQLRRRIEEDHADLRVIPLIGTSGNINHFDPHGPECQSGIEVAERIGASYARSVLAALPALRTVAVPTLAADSLSFTTGPRTISDAELADARRIVRTCSFDASRELTSEDLAAKSPAALRYFAEKVLAVAARHDPKTFEVGAIHLGAAALVTLPGEPFVEIGLALRRQAHPPPHLLLATLNQDAQYIPNPGNFGRGGYETTPRCSPYTCDTGARLLDAASQLLARLST